MSGKTSSAHPLASASLSCDTTPARSSLKAVLSRRMFAQSKWQPALAYALDSDKYQDGQAWSLPPPPGHDSSAPSYVAAFTGWVMKELAPSLSHLIRTMNHKPLLMYFPHKTRSIWVRWCKKRTIHLVGKDGQGLLWDKKQAALPDHRELRWDRR